MAKRGTTSSDNNASVSKSGTLVPASKEDCVIETYARLVSGIRTQLQNFTTGDTVLIGNCPNDAGEEDLNKFFQGFATIVKLQKVDCKPLTTTVYIAKFDSVESASRSKVLNTLTLKGKRILLLKSDGAHLFNKNKVVELNGLQEHPEEVIYDHMSTFGTINFILKTNTVTYIVFEEASAIEASCRCDYLDKYPVTIRSVLDVPAGSGSQPGASIETCILEQIEQNSSLLVEEEGQINNFMQLLDMENLDDYLDQDEKDKGVVVDKPLLEVGNEEIIATEESVDGQQVGDDADVAAIEKQAFQQPQQQPTQSEGTILVDDQSARKLKLRRNSLLLTDLPQLQVVVRSVGKDWRKTYGQSKLVKETESSSGEKPAKSKKSRIKSRPNSAAKEAVKPHDEDLAKRKKSKKKGENTNETENRLSGGKEVSTEKVKSISKSESSKKSKIKRPISSGMEATNNSEIISKTKTNKDEKLVKHPLSGDIAKVNQNEKTALPKSDDKGGKTESDTLSHKMNSASEMDCDVKSSTKKEETKKALEEQHTPKSKKSKAGPNKSQKPDVACKSPENSVREPDQKVVSKDPDLQKETVNLKSDGTKKDEISVDQNKPKKRPKGKPYYKKPNLKPSQSQKVPVVIVVKLSSSQLDKLSIVQRDKVAEQLSTNKEEEIKPVETHSHTDSSDNRKRKHDDDVTKESGKSKKIKERTTDINIEKITDSKEKLGMPTIEETEIIDDVKADTPLKFPQKESDEGDKAVVIEKTSVLTSENVENLTSELSLGEATVDTSAEKTESVLEMVQPEPTILISASVPDACNTVEVGQNDTSANFLSDDECPLVIDLPPEPIPEPRDKEVEIKPLEGTKQDRVIVSLDSKSATLLEGKIHNGYLLYLDLLPRLGIKLKRVDAAGYRAIKRKDSPPPKSKSLVKSSTGGTSQEEKRKSTTGTTSHEEKRNPTGEVPPHKKREENPAEKPRKTDLEKIDNRFLPAGSKLKSQAKAKSKKETSHKKHLPVPELPIELKAHLNTSFKIPKRNVKPQSIDRNASELNSLHGDQTKEEKEKQRKRFQKERKQWDGRTGQQQGPRDKKPKLSEAPVQREPSPDYFDPSFDDPSDSSPPPAQQPAREENNKPQKQRQENNRNVRNPPFKEFGNKRPNFNDIWNIPREKPKIWDSEPGNQKPAGNAWNSGATQTIDSGDSWAPEKPAQRSFEGRDDNKRNITIDAGECWSQDGPAVPRLAPGNSINSSANWNPGTARQNRPNDLNRAPENRPLPSNSIGDGESWSPGPKRRPDPDHSTPLKKDVQDNRRNMLDARNRSPIPSNTIAAGDMWDLNADVARQQPSSQCERNALQRRQPSPQRGRPENPSSGRRQPSPQRGRPENPSSGRRQPSPQRGRPENRLSGRREPSPRREQFGNTISSGDTWDVDIELVRPRLADFEPAKRRGSDHPDGDRRFVEKDDRNETLLRRERGDRSPGRHQDQRRSPEMRPGSHRSLSRQSPVRPPHVNIGRSRDRSPFDGRRRGSPVRSPIRMRSPHSVWGPDGSPNRRKRSRSRSVDRMRRSMERLPLRNDRIVDHSPDGRSRIRERSVDSWGRPCGRSPKLRMRNIDRSPRMEGYRISPNRSMQSPSRGERFRSQDRPFSSDHGNVAMDDRFRTRPSDSRSPRRNHSPSMDRWNSRADNLENRENPWGSPHSRGFERLEREPFNRDSHIPPGLDRRSRSHSHERMMNRELVEPGDKSWPSSLGRDLGVDQSDERINKSNYTPWVNESKPQVEDVDDNIYSPSNALDTISSDEECDFTNPARRLRKAPDRSASPSPRKQLATIPLEIPSHTNVALIQEGMEADSPSRDSFGSVPPIGRNRDKQDVEQVFGETLPEAELYDQTNALDLLKQRAERLKKLEEMKMARQKLLAQFKQKYGSQPPLPTAEAPPIPPDDIPPPPPPQDSQSSGFVMVMPPVQWQPPGLPPSIDLSQPPPNMPHSLFSSMPPPLEKVEPAPNYGEEQINYNSPPPRFRRNFDGPNRRSFNPSQDKPPLHLFQPKEVQENRWPLFNPDQNESIPQLLPPEEIRSMKSGNLQINQMEHRDPRQNRGGSNDRGSNRGESNDRRQNRGGSNDRGQNRGVSGERGQNRGGSNDRGQNRGISGDRGQNRGGSGDRRQNWGGPNLSGNNQRKNRNFNNNNNNNLNREDQFQRFNQDQPNQLFNNDQQQHRRNRFNRNNNNFDEEQQPQMFGQHNDDIGDQQFQQGCDEDFGLNQQFQRGNDDEFDEQQFQDCDDFGNQQFQRGNFNDFGNQQFQQDDDFDNQPFQGENDDNFDNQQFQHQQMFQGNNNDFDDQDQFQQQQQQRFRRNNNNFNNRQFQQRFRGGNNNNNNNSNNNFGGFEEGCFDMNDMNDVGDIDGNDPEWADLME